MNDAHPNHPSRRHDPDLDQNLAPELDHSLRAWHDARRRQADGCREAVLNRLVAAPDAPGAPGNDTEHQKRSRLALLLLFRRLFMHRYAQLTMTLTIVTILAALLFPPGNTMHEAQAQDGVILAPEGGRLDALDADGQLIGPCPLEHTDVDVQIIGHFTRVNVTQRYKNPYDTKIEAVYTFPLSHRGAVDRMTMTVGDRVVEGEVKRRDVARQMYEAARAEGYVASLLEQERPNIFTQSVANIEPGAEVVIRISYVEVLESTDGEYRFDFPMVVAPRYIPGSAAGVQQDALPPIALPRRGVILLGPGEVRLDDGRADSAMADFLHRTALPIRFDADQQTLEAHDAQVHTIFSVKYSDGREEPGVLLDDGLGHVGGRWFYCPPRLLPNPGEPFSTDTPEVPDASRITPMPVMPNQRAGHDISVSITIDTGGPRLMLFESLDHEITGDEVLNNHGMQPTRMTVSLAAGREIPNRDFRLRWRTQSDRIQESIFTHTGNYGDFEGGFFTLVLQPPDRVEEADIRPRDLIFVLDSSGSMSSAGLAGMSAHDAAKRVIIQSIDTMRPNDRFNVISFNNSTDMLWNEPQPNTEANRARAQRYVDERLGGGGTEMRSAILRALGAEPVMPRPEANQPLSALRLANLPADDREVTVRSPMTAIEVRGEGRYVLRASHDILIDIELRAELPTVLQPEGVDLLLTGRWTTQRGRRVFIIHDTRMIDALEEDVEPMRIVLFVTDGLVGNDDAIIQAIRDHAHNTRVFTVGMSHAPNRHLLDEMARAGRGGVDYVLPNDDVAPIVERFARRIATPVLTDIDLDFGEGLIVTDVLPSPEQMPDLFDMQPLVIHGRYTNPGAGTLTIRGRTGAGRYERRIALDLPALEPQHDTIATLWAREKVAELTRGGSLIPQVEQAVAVEQIVALGEKFSIMTPHTSFVAIEKRRVTIGGESMLVRVPIEFPHGMSWEGTFGMVPGARAAVDVSPDITVNELLIRVREAQANREYALALGYLHVILQRQPDHPAALALRDAINTSQLWQQYIDDNRGRERNMTIMFQENRAATVGPGLKSTTSMLVHPTTGALLDPLLWPRQSGRRLDSATILPSSQGRPALDLSGSVGGGGGFGGGGGGGIEPNRGRTNMPPPPPPMLPAELGPANLGGRAVWGEIPQRTEYFFDTGSATPSGQVFMLRLILDQDGTTISHAEAVELARDLRATLGVDGDGRPTSHLMPLGIVHAGDEPVALTFFLLAPLAEVLEEHVKTLDDETLTDEARQTALTALLQTLEQAAPRLRRSLTLHQRLDDSLNAMLDEDAAERTLLVTILLRDLEPETLDALRDAGCEILDTASDRTFIIGRIRSSDLKAIGLLEHVRRVEVLSR